MIIRLNMKFLLECDVNGADRQADSSIDNRARVTQPTGMNFTK